jgi:hypothetical protein
VPSDDAVIMARRLAVEEGLFCGISSGEGDSEDCRLRKAFKLIVMAHLAFQELRLLQQLKWLLGLRIQESWWQWFCQVLASGTCLLSCSMMFASSVRSLASTRRSYSGTRQGKNDSYNPAARADSQY